ncbi:hypothetical protein CL617_03915 [archaeon]|nr:hypothetical protein [archaeon]|tara:strand:+ start:16329 stop:17576 length:1248 start_codon:yes stop_codon:yes gene_type:complete
MEPYEVLIFIAYFISFFISMVYIAIFLYNRDDFITKVPKDYEKNALSVTVLIPAYNKEDILADTIKSILNQDYPKDKIEIIVINDGSKDKTKEVAKSFKEVTLINKENAGKASALNDGIKVAKNDIIVVLDADTLMTEELTKKAVSYFKDDAVGVVIPTLKPYKPKNLLERIQVVEYTLSGFTRKILSFINSSSAAPACSYFRREIFEDYGGFDVDNITEDFEMALKIQSHNHKLVHLTDAVAYTDVPKKLKELLRQRLRWCYGNLFNLKKYKSIFGKKYGDFGLLFLPMILISILLSLAILFSGIFGLAESFFRKILLAYKINFNFSFNFDFNRILAELTNPKIFLGVIIFFLALFIVYLARKYTRQSKQIEKINGTNIGILTYLVYAFIYSLILVNVWLIAIFYILVKKKPSW